jgi:hypothetical protein
MSATDRKNILMEALAYRRHIGATLDDIRGYAQFRMKGTHSREADQRILAELVTAGRIYSVGGKWFLTTAVFNAARGSAFKPEWEKTDAWILLSILYCKGSPGALSEIIGEADFINHDIPTLEHLHGGLNRLLAGGLIRMKHDGFIATKNGFNLYANVQAKRYVLDQLEALERILDCPCCGVRLKAVRWQVHMDDKTFDQAYKTYRDMMMKAKV